MSKLDIIVPTVNINGTDASDLKLQWMFVAKKCDELMAALHSAMPHGRDYPRERLSPAIDQCRELLKATSRIKAVAEALYWAIDEQKD